MTRECTTGLDDAACAGVLRFWFDEAWNDPEAARDRSSFWYGGAATLDDTIRERFGRELDLASSGALRHWEETATGALAVVVLLDQFSRHCHRGTARAFANDPLALAVAKRAVAAGLATSLPPPGHVFLLHPFHHSEVLAEQERYVAAIDALARTVPPAWREFVQGCVRYAIHHRDVIARFGRFPHRNEALGRPSTEAEREYVERPDGLN